MIKLWSRFCECDSTLLEPTNPCNLFASFFNLKSDSKVLEISVTQENCEIFS